MQPGTSGFFLRRRPSAPRDDDEDDAYYLDKDAMTCACTELVIIPRRSPPFISTITRYIYTYIIIIYNPFFFLLLTFNVISYYPPCYRNLADITGYGNRLILLLFNIIIILLLPIILLH